MTASEIKSVLDKANQLITAGKLDDAIDTLRVEKSNESAEISALLARIYYKRGDAKGDVHSSSFFAKRAIELGAPTNELYSICAIGAFRKEKYETACEYFAKYVDDSFEASTKYLYGLSLYLAGSLEAALKQLNSAHSDQPKNTAVCDAITQVKAAIAKGNNLKSVKPSKRPVGLGGVNNIRPVDVDTPYEDSALSKLAGIASQYKDMDYIAKSIPCQTTCPAHTDIPSYLTAIYNGCYDDAYKINLRDNIFPAVLGRVCARPCESDCRHGRKGLGKSVAICHSKRVSSDYKDEELVVLDKIFEPSGKKVSIIGGGPSGLAAARNLALLGHDVTVYEKHDTPGGMMIQGIPEFRLPRKHIAKEIEQIAALGVEIKCGINVGSDIKVSEIKDKSDAVVLACGTFKPNNVNLEGKDLDGIQHGLEFLGKLNSTGDAPAAKNVVIVGGGFTAMDCARAALRVGNKLNGESWQEKSVMDSPSKVTVMYRRSVEEMLVTPGELEELEHEGIGLELLVSPIEYIGKDGKVTGVKFIKNELGEPDASGRRRPVAVEGSEFIVDAELVLLATGQFPETSILKEDYPELVDDKDDIVSENSYSTKVKGLFVAGDFVNGAQSIIQSIGHAKECVVEIDSFLMGEKRIEEVILIEDADATGRYKEMDEVDVNPMNTIEKIKRTLTGEVETGFTKSDSIEETQRCYRCHYKYEIDHDKCIYCGWCIKAMSQDNCITAVKSLKYGENGEIIGYEKANSTEEINQIYINQADCIRCNQCVDACPVDAISIQKVSRTNSCGGKCGSI